MREDVPPHLRFQGHKKRWHVEVWELHKGWGTHLRDSYFMSWWCVDVRVWSPLPGNHSFCPFIEVHHMFKFTPQRMCALFEPRVSPRRMRLSKNCPRPWTRLGPESADETWSDRDWNSWKNSLFQQGLWFWICHDLQILLRRLSFLRSQWCCRWWLQLSFCRSCYFCVWISCTCNTTSGSCCSFSLRKLEWTWWCCEEWDCKSKWWTFGIFDPISLLPSLVGIP